MINITGIFVITARVKAMVRRRAPQRGRTLKKVYLVCQVELNT